MLIKAIDRQKTGLENPEYVELRKDGKKIWPMTYVSSLSEAKKKIIKRVIK